MAHAATMAITPTKDSRSIAPYPMKRAWLSRRIIFGVVPEEINEWKPLIAPQAMVIKQKGKIFPAKTGPVPSMKRVSGGIKICGRTKRMPTAREKIAPALMNALR
jgi:hypothetical protein